MKVISIFIAVSLCCSSCQAQTKTSLNATAFGKAISNKDSVQVLDVRTPGEYKSGHIANALLADWNDRKEFDRRAGFLKKDKPVYIYCLSGGRSAAAASDLRKKGFMVYELVGGTNEWKMAGKALEGATARTQMTLDEFDRQIRGNSVVLVDFGAEWCPPCKLMEPVLGSLQQNHAGKFSLVKVDGGNDEEIMRHYKVTALPVFIIFKNGKETWRREGIVTEEDISAQL